MKVIFALNSNIKLPDDINSCHDLIQKLFLNIEDLKKNLRLANIEKYGASSEKMKSFEEFWDKKLQGILSQQLPLQLELFGDLQSEVQDYINKNTVSVLADDELVNIDPEEEEKNKNGSNKQRLKNTESLETVECHHGNDLEHCPNCDSSHLSEIGVENTKEIEIIPAKIIVKEHIVHKVKCNDCNAIHRGDKPQTPLHKCSAGASLLSHIAYNRFGQYLTYYRISRDFFSKGLEISEANLCNWMNNLANDIFSPLYRLMAKQLVESDVIYADETVLRELAKGKCKQMYVWGYTNPYNKNILLDYSTRDSDNPSLFLKDFKNGYLVTDKYGGYNEIVKRNNLNRCYCWVHARRSFYKILKAADDPSKLPEIRTVYIQITKILKMDKEIRKGDKSLIVELRQKRVLPLIEELYVYLENLKQLNNYVLFKSAQTAIDYILNAKQEFKEFLNHQEVEPSNNISERILRFLTIGRKNWLFAGSSRGGKTIAIIASIVASAKQYNLNVTDYLTYVISEMPKAKVSEIQNFLPQNLTDKFQLKQK